MQFYSPFGWVGRNREGLVDQDRCWQLQPVASVVAVEAAVGECFAVHLAVRLAAVVRSRILCWKNAVAAAAGSSVVVVVAKAVEGSGVNIKTLFAVTDVDIINGDYKKSLNIFAPDVDIILNDGNILMLGT